MDLDIPESQYGFIFHYYRAEVYRETNWRNRLDATTNWAIIVTAAILSFAFGEARSPHTVILFNFLVVLFFLYIESRRFKFFILLRNRTRLIEKHILANVFSGKGGRKKAEFDWKKSMSDRLRHPEIHLSHLESVSWRLRRTYIFIFVALFLTWIVKVCSAIQSNITWLSFTQYSRLWFIPGEIITVSFASVIILFLMMSLVIPNKSKMDDLP